MHRLLLPLWLSAFAILSPAQILYGGGNQQQLTTPESKVKPEERCTVAGQITNALSGEPVKRATVRLTVRNDSGPRGLGTPSTFGGPSQQGYTATSEADGTFHFENVEPGRYTLSATKQGFLDSGRTAYRAANSETLFTLAPSQSKTGLTLQVIPQAVIGGKVVDDEGEPVAMSMVQALQAHWMKGKLRYLPAQATNTNDLGEFRIANLAPGKYFLAVQKFPGLSSAPAAPVAKDKPDLRPVRTFYPGVLTQDAATMLEVKAGQDLTGIEIRQQLQATYHVRGKTPPLNEGTRDNSVVSLTARNTADVFSMSGQGKVNPDGTFDIPGIVPGSYTATMMVMKGNFRSVARANVDVTTADVSDVVLTAVPAGTIRGRVVLENGNPIDLTSVRINLASDFAFGPPPHSETKADGSFTLDDVDAGKYTVNVNTPRGTYLKSVLYGQTDVKATDLDLSGGASGELQVVLRSGTAQLDGSLQLDAQANGKIPAGVHVVLIPEDTAGTGWGMRQSLVDTAGTFSMAEVPPGKYSAYAIENMQYEQLQDPAVLKELQSKATSLELKENDRKQLTLPVLTAADYQQLLSRAGVPTDQ